MLTAGEINIMIRARDQASRTLGRIGNAAARMGQMIRRAALVGVAGLAVLGVAAFRFAGDFDDAANTIRRGTGATGEALEGLKEDFRETFRDVPDSMADVATATADLNTRLGLTGPPLQAMTRQFLDLARVAEVDVATAIAAGTRVFGDWSIAVDDQAAALDRMFVVSQTTGIGVDALAQKVVQFGAPLRQFGFGFEEATALLGSWEREGVNAEAILGALKIGVANFARENIDAATGLQDFIDELTELGPGAEATGRAIELFGSRAGPDMAAAVTEGRFALDELMATLDSSSETIAAAAEETLTWKDKLRTLRNELLVRAAPALAAMTEKAEEFSDWLIEKGLPKAEEFAEALREDLQPAVEFLKDAFEFLRPKIEAVSRIIIRLIRFLNDHREVLLAVAIAITVTLVPAFVAWAVAAGAAAVATIAATLPVIAIIAAIALLVLGIILLIQHWDEVSEFLMDTWRTVTDFVVDKVLWLKDQIVEKFELIKSTMISAITEAVDNVITFFTELPGNILEAIGDVAGTLAGKGGALIQGLWDGAVFAFGSVRQWFTDLPGLIIEALGDLGRLLYNAGRDLVQGFIDGITSLISSIPNPLDFLPDLTPGFDIPGIPFGAHGGIVTRPTLALLGEAGPEAVIPLSRAPGASELPGGLPGQNITIIVNVEDPSPAAIAHAVERAGLELGEQLAAEGV